MTQRASAATRRTAFRLSLAAIVGPARSQPAGPFRPARLITPAPAGTSGDVAARLLADGLSRRRGHPIAVENRPGADGILAAEAFVQARAGEALFFSSSGIVTVVPAVAALLPFDPDADLVPIAGFVNSLTALFVTATLPVRDVAAFIDHVRARPGALNWFGLSGGPYLAFRGFLRESGGLDMVFVSYRASPPALLDLAAGRIQVALTSLPLALPLVREGRIRPLLLMNTTRATIAPDVPTAIEAGAPELVTDGALGLFGWRGIPDAARATLATQAAEVLAEPGTAERLRASGMEPRGSASPAAFVAELARDSAKWAPLAREFGARPAA